MAKPTVQWYDDQGLRIDDPREAAFGEVYDNGTRVYVDASSWSEEEEGVEVTPAPNFDWNVPWAGPDLIKTGTWDVRNEDHSIVTTLEELFDYLGVSDQDDEVKADVLSQFTFLPVWTPAPTGLRREVARWRRTHQTGP